MASTFTTTKTDASTIVPARSDVSTTTAWETYTVAAALVINDAVQMVKIPAGATILDVVCSVTDLDNVSSTSTLTLDVGDGNDDDRFIAGSTIGAAGGVARLDQQAGHCYTYTADDTIDVSVKAAPVTGATSGTIRLSVLYTMEQ